jgi:membrane associated rhomboid family serine protease
LPSGYGHARFLVLFVGAGAFGALASLAHQAQLASTGQGLNAGSIGASGAVFGVGAAVVVAAVRMHALPAWRVRALIGRRCRAPLELRRGVRQRGDRQRCARGRALAGLVLGLALPFSPKLTQGPPESPVARGAWGRRGAVRAVGAGRQRCRGIHESRVIAYRP